MAHRYLVIFTLGDVLGSFANAQWLCKPPKISGYDFSSLGGVLTTANFAPTGIKCAEGYLGDEIQYRECQRDDGDFQVFGCKEIVKDDGISVFGAVTINQYEDASDCAGTPAVYSLQDTVQGFLNGSCTRWKISYDPSPTERGDGRETEVYMTYQCNGTGLIIATYSDPSCMVEVSDVVISSRQSPVRTLRGLDNLETVRLFADECAASDGFTFKLGQHPQTAEETVGLTQNCSGWCPADYLSCSTAVPTPVPTPALPTPIPTPIPTPAPTSQCRRDDDCTSDGSSNVCIAGDCQPPLCSNSSGGLSSAYPCKCGRTMQATTLCQLLAGCTATDDLDGVCKNYHNGSKCGDDANNCCAYDKVCTDGYFVRLDPECFFTTSSSCPENWCYGCFPFKETTTTTTTTASFSNTTARVATASSKSLKIRVSMWWLGVVLALPMRCIGTATV